MKNVNEITINLFVNDIGASSKFYTEIFDFKITDDWEKHGLDPENLPPGFWTSVLAVEKDGNLYAHVSLNELDTPNTTSIGGRVQFEVYRDDLQEYYTSLKEKGVKIVKDLYTQRFSAGESRETVKQYKYEAFVVEDNEGYHWAFRTQDEMVEE